MRKLLLLFFLLSVGTVHAQLQRGDRLILFDHAADFRSPQPVPEAGAGLSLYRRTDVERTVLQAGGGFGVALLDGLLVGGQVRASILSGEYGLRAFSLHPFVRYYFLNAAAPGAFGQLQSGVDYDGTDLTAFGSATVSAGVQLPVGGGARLTPYAGYTVAEGANSLQLGARLELRLRYGAADTTPVVRFRRGTLLLGGQLASATLTENTRRLTARTGAHFFLTRRLAVAAVAGYGGSYESYQFRDGDGERYVRFRELHLGAGLRYLLTTGHRLVAYGEAGAGRLWESLDSNAGIDYFPGSFTYVTAGAGAMYLLNAWLAVEAGPQLRYDLTNERWVPGVNFGFRIVL
ncbi:hypothetical protein [Lewinella sp. IMCC34183]|uniref:hypothetical protein n=1 Tax=Lewinella sp. IMCC34183 TaxID=2248762 RepID=UPI000E22C372|nr:hypothetical protein [Lewinella sp. IMCC34183]